MAPSTPKSSPERTSKHLGTGAGRPFRSQLALMLFGLLVLVAVPLYLLRRPGKTASTADAGAPSVFAPGTDGGLVDAVAPDAPTAPRGLSLSEPRTIRCGPTARNKALSDVCEGLPFFQDALRKAVRENVACAPVLPQGGTVSFVLSVDFARKKTHLWAGHSGSVRRRASADLLRCVARALPEAPWETIAHPHVKYDIALLATYPSTP